MSTKDFNDRTSRTNSTRSPPTPATWCSPSASPSASAPSPSSSPPASKTASSPSAPWLPSSPSTTPPASWCAAQTCSPSAPWSSSSSAAAGAPTASPSWKPGAISTAPSASADALMVAIGPQTERQSDFMAGQHGLPFPVLSRPRQRPRRAVRPRLHRSRVPPRLLPLHPGQHPLCQRRAKLASSHARNLRHRQRPQSPLRRSPRRLPRPPRARRSPSRRLRSPQPLIQNQACHPDRAQASRGICSCSCRCSYDLLCRTI